MNEEHSTNPAEVTKKSFFQSLFGRFFQGELKNRDDLVEVIRDSEQNDLIDQNTREMIEGVMEIAELRVRDIMIPHSQIVFIEDQQNLNTCLNTIIESAHSRFPVIADADDRDNIAGILHAKDLLKFLREDSEEFDLSKLLVKGIVVVKKGQDLTENDIRSKLNLPDGVNIVEIEYPNTNTLGKKVAKVTFIGNDGNLFTIEVPVEVVENTTNTVETNNNRYPEGRVLVNKNTEQTNKEGLKASKNMLPNTGTTETNTGLAGLGLGILGALLAATRRRKEK